MWPELVEFVSWYCSLKPRCPRCRAELCRKLICKLVNYLLIITELESSFFEFEAVNAGILACNVKSHRENKTALEMCFIRLKFLWWKLVSFGISQWIYFFLSTKRQRQRSSQISYGKLDVTLEKIHFQKCERLRLKLNFTNILRAAIAPLDVCCFFDSQFGVYGTKVGLDYQEPILPKLSFFRFSDFRC